MCRNLLAISLLLFCLAQMRPAVAVTSASIVGVSDSVKGPTAEQILKEASKHLGKPYRYGGQGPNSFDCAGFVRYVFGRFGIPLAYSCAPQYLAGVPVDEYDLVPGDLVFFGGRKASRSIGHVGIVSSVDPVSGTFEFVHAARTGVRYSKSDEDYYRMRYISACRILTGETPTHRTVQNPVVEMALDLYMPDTNSVFSYLAGENMEDWIRSQGQGSEWMALLADTIRLVVGEPAPNLDGVTFCRWGVTEDSNVVMGRCDFVYEAHCQSEWQKDSVRRVLHGLRSASDVVVVSFPSSDDDLPDAQRFARLCVELGADVVCCYGVENTHLVEYYEGRLILYGLGASCFVEGCQPSEFRTLVEAYLLEGGRLQGGQVTSRVREMPSAAGGLQVEFDGSFNIQ